MMYPGTVKKPFAVDDQRRRVAQAADELSAIVEHLHAIADSLSPPGGAGDIVATLAEDIQNVRAVLDELWHE